MPKIPEQARCVFKGVLFDVYQWEQTLFDGSTATFEMVKRPNTAVVIPVLPDGRVCYSRQEQPGKPPFMGLFGGRAEDEHEQPLVTAQRELLEEAGLEADDWQVWLTTQPASKTDWTVTYFIARNCRRVAAPRLDAGERIEVCTATAEEFIDTVVMDVAFQERELRQTLCQTVTPEQRAALLAGLEKR
jgi:ADP-ribose pyrophosphatase